MSDIQYLCWGILVICSHAITFIINISVKLVANALLLKYQIPEEEKNLGPQDRLIHVYHFSKETAQNQMVWSHLEFFKITFSNLILRLPKAFLYHTFYNTLFVQQQVQNFGEPFFLVIHEGETLADVKVRIQKKLQVPDEEFSKVGSSSCILLLIDLTFPMQLILVP